jgi:GNAT superfamily N-acetyltransferase
MKRELFTFVSLVCILNSESTFAHIGGENRGEQGERKCIDGVSVMANQPFSIQIGDAEIQYELGSRNEEKTVIARFLPESSLIRVKSISSSHREKLLEALFQKFPTEPVLITYRGKDAEILLNALPTLVQNAETNNPLLKNGRPFKLIVTKGDAPASRNVIAIFLPSAMGKPNEFVNCEDIRKLIHKHQMEQVAGTELSVPAKFSTDKSLLQFDVVYGFLSNSYWSANLSKIRMQRAIENSLNVGVYLEGKQVGYARIITDYATYAYLCDVFVLGSHRRLGLSKALMKYVIELPELEGIKRFALITKDAQGLYQKFGFENMSHPEMYMEVNKSGIYGLLDE